MNTSTLRYIALLLCCVMFASCAYPPDYSPPRQYHTTQHSPPSHRQSVDPAVPLLIGAVAVGAMVAASKSKKRHRHYHRHHRSHYDHHYSHGRHYDRGHCRSRRYY